MTLLPPIVKVQLALGFIDMRMVLQGVLHQDPFTGRTRATGINVKQPSLLTGRLFDETGEGLTPTWSIKNVNRRPILTPHRRPILTPLSGGF
jgi:hypothetical protein